MKRVLMILVVAIVAPVEAKTKSYANGWITVTTRRSPYYRSYSGYNHYNRDRYRQSGTTYYDEKEGIYIKRDYTIRDVLFGGGDDQLNQTLAISRQTRLRQQEKPKPTIEEMAEQARKIKAMQRESRAVVNAKEKEEWKKEKEETAENLNKATEKLNEAAEVLARILKEKEALLKENAKLREELKKAKTAPNTNTKE